ncbi:hypothetical protein LT02_004701 [Salmonella enterica]|nr:hypothetical protein [Salmonella enterica]ECG1483854.1 hypothetical protein [Salmonella enterica subsp. enterica]ECI6492929.1 hypothetical protein [Salmonella enterica subsp. enterica]ECJ6058866.1 hypothetical protein [Salmonella enterica]ECJ6176298.1 hypothetical protein [Salmonella enterica]
MKYIIFTIRIIWLMLSVLILIFSIYRLSLLDSVRDVSELISIMSYGMMMISFPISIVSFLVLMFIGFISSIIDLSINNKYIITVIIWFFFLSGGYIQWFVLINKLRKKE